MIVAGMDVSGDAVVGNYKYLAIVIGTKENIQSLSDKISPTPTRMSTLGAKSKEVVISKLNFDGKNRIAFCVALNRTHILEQVKNTRLIKKSKKPTGKIIRTFNYVVMRKVMSKLNAFAEQNSVSLHEIVFECDSDCIPFANALNVRSKSEGKAHNVADKVAWCNNKGQSPSSVIEIDFTDEIASTMVKMLNLK